MAFFRLGFNVFKVFISLGPVAFEMSSVPAAKEKLTESKGDQKQWGVGEKLTDIRNVAIISGSFVLTIIICIAIRERYNYDFRRVTHADQLRSDEAKLKINLERRYNKTSWFWVSRQVALSPSVQLLRTYDLTALTGCRDCLHLKQIHKFTVLKYLHLRRIVALRHPIRTHTELETQVQGSIACTVTVYPLLANRTSW
jgi:hypothetical protein